MDFFGFFKKHWWCLVIVVITFVVGTVAAKYWGGSATPVFRRVRFFNASDDMIPRVEIKDTTVVGNPVIATLFSIAPHRMDSADADSGGFVVTVNGMNVAYPNVTSFEVLITVPDAGGPPRTLAPIAFSTQTGSFGEVSLRLKKNPSVPPAPPTWEVLAYAFHESDEDNALQRATTSPSPVTLN